MPRFRLEAVVRRYRQGAERNRADVLRVPSLEVRAGEFLAVVGPNGGGKSTLLETMAYLARPEEGRVLLDDRDPWATGQSLAARRRCPMLLQRTVLFQTTVLGNLCVGLRARGISRYESQRRAVETLGRMGLAHLAHRRPHELSGGEQRRIDLARLLALQSDTLLLDEPTAHVDRYNAELIEEVIRRRHQEAGTTVILATHETEQAKALADRVLTVLDGQLLEGTLDSLLCGALLPKNGGYELQTLRGVTLVLSGEYFDLRGNQQLPESPIACELAVRADRLNVLPDDPQSTPHLRGLIVSVQHKRQHARLEVELPGGETLQVAMESDEYAARRWNVAAKVSLQFQPGAVRLLRTGLGRLIEST